MKGSHCLKPNLGMKCEYNKRERHIYTHIWKTHVHTYERETHIYTHTHMISPLLPRFPSFCPVPSLHHLILPSPTLSLLRPLFFYPFGRTKFSCLKFWSSNQHLILSLRITLIWLRGWLRVVFKTEFFVSYSLLLSSPWRSHMTPPL